jgi:hypothetical protein
MHSPAAAMAWEFWGRHRIGLSLFGAFVLICSAITATIPLPNHEKLASVTTVGAILGLCYLIVVFAHGSEVRLETADSGFPARFFVLPVRTSVLVGWPMLGGSLTAVIAWVAWDQLVLRPAGINTPFWWAMMLGAIVATTQALLWIPFGLPWIRLPVAVVVLTSLIRAPAFLALAGTRFTNQDTQNIVLSLFAAGVIPVAFLLAWAGVACARRGDSPDWLRFIRSFRWVWPAKQPTWQERSPFSSALRAQAWYEWRLRGIGFPLLVFFVIAALMVLALVLTRSSHTLTNYSVLFLVLPVIFAGMFGSFTGTTGEVTRSLFVLPGFAATRPVSNTAFVMAKLWAAGMAAVVTWVMVLGLTLGWLLFTGGTQDLQDLWDFGVSDYGVARTAGFCVFFAFGPILIIWRLLIGNLWVGLAGRVWVWAVQSIVVVLLGLGVLYELVMWNYDPARRDRIITALPLLACIAVVVKLVVGMWLLRVLVRRGEIAVGSAWLIVCIWFAVAAALFGLLAWLNQQEFVSTHNLALGVMLFLPLTRLALAPLALAWNRHR